ncbi:YtxH domain-containing protein [Desulfovibrio sp. JC010]|uniref:YtxH domain-containing protein n=1 Tax=Desulfovibrio sp. JC010 TaxID=2593641 RepID=UPI0013D8389B|nr:YtxH domain-containing protein [Desulfovibrio sp. JC010]NDV28886.1 YtxH domain-containing protein [Desulfovibrio sp. JC010]
MNWMKKVIYALCLVAVMAVVSGCEDNEGAGEKLGKQFDQAMEQAKDKMDEMSGQAKDKAREALDKAKESLDN